MATSLTTYIATTAVVAAIIAVQIVAAKGSIGLLLLLSLVNALLVAAYGMGLKYEPRKAVALVWLIPLLAAMAFALGMLTA